MMNYDDSKERSDLEELACREWGVNYDDNLAAKEQVSPKKAGSWHELAIIGLQEAGPLSVAACCLDDRAWRGKFRVVVLCEKELQIFELHVDINAGFVVRTTTRCALPLGRWFDVAIRCDKQTAIVCGHSGVVEISHGRIKPWIAGVPHLPIVGVNVMTRFTF